MDIHKTHRIATVVAFILACTLLILQYLDTNPLSYQATFSVLIGGAIVLIALTWIRTIALAKENRGEEWTTYAYPQPLIDLTQFTPALSLLILSNVVESRMTTLLWYLGMVALAGILINYAIQYFYDYPRFVLNKKQLIVYSPSYSVVEVSEIKQIQEKGDRLVVQTKRGEVTLRLKQLNDEERNLLLERLT